MVVVLPSPAGVGLMPVTRTSAPSGWSAWLSMKSNPIFALVRPYGSMAAGGMPAAAAISAIGRKGVASAISISLRI